ncbi:MAG TPA: hydrogen peroxide-inducible genes activator [Polyangiales bacterium]|jgi:LysR family hydrogen peroxide-inducible transcriptional activator|nr:hydrogen peroxide-inducible genes activator [Polyangiales bacterium]
MNLSALTVQQLRYVVALDRHRNFGDAAMASHVSQPALSSQVKKVEELLGVRIFDRSRQPILPTERGVRVILQARRALEQIERIGLVASEHEDLCGPYRLGVIPTLASTLLPLFLPLFARQHPGVSLEIVETKTEVMLRALREGTLDSGIAATPLNLPGIGEHVICHEAFYAYLPPDHPLTSRARIRQADLLDESVWLLGEGHCFRSQVLALCSADRNRKDAGQVTFDVSSFETLVGMVDAGYGVTILPELFVTKLTGEQQRAQVRPFILPEPVREIGFLHAREHLRETIGAELYRALCEAIPSQIRARHADLNSVLHPMA